MSTVNKQPFTPAQIHWDHNGQPLSDYFDDVYFSTKNGLKETRYVFLQYNQLKERFTNISTNTEQSNPIFTIAETGFGTGLNFLATWELFNQVAPPHAHLHFISVEKFPLTHTDLQQSLKLWPQLNVYAQQLLNAYPTITGYDTHRLTLAKNISLTLIINDATAGLQQLLGSSHVSILPRKTSIDAWFLDGFAPSKNPNMWNDKLFSVMRKLSHSSTTLSTFTAAGLVKKGLQQAGFAIKKVPGYKKRDMLTATVQSIETPTPTMATINTPAQAIVIGAGLAGCHTARALARRGWQVTIIEKDKCIANAGSGNPQGLVYVRLSHKRETLPLFNLACLEYAKNAYRKFWGNNSDNSASGSPCGILQLAITEKIAQQYANITQIFNNAGALVKWLNATEASQLAGVKLQYGGLFFPNTGWVNPKTLCEQLLDHKNIRVIVESTVTQLVLNNNCWQALSSNTVIADAPVVVCSSAEHTQLFEQLSHLPLKSIRGQISQLAETPASTQLNTALCAEGYLAPTNGESHCLGATFNLHENNKELRMSDHKKNLEHLSEFGPAVTSLFETQSQTQINGRVGFRCSTPDYLPIVGPAPIFSDFLKNYAPLRKDAKTIIDNPPQYWPGLYINCGHGSRGLAYTPLSAEILACQINQEPMPVNPSLVDALNPARFIIRNLTRNKL